MKNTETPTNQTQSTNIKSNTQITSQLTSKNKTLWVLVILVVLLSGSIGVFAYKYYELKQQVDNKQSTVFTEATTTPSYNENNKANSQEEPYQTRDVVSIINQDEDWGYVTVKKTDDEINAMKAVKYLIISPIQVNKVLSYGKYSPCPVVSYRLSHNNQDYNLQLFLGHFGLPRFTKETTDNILSNGKQFTRESHFTENDLTGVFYRSSTLIINDKNNRSFEYTWMAYFKREDYGNIDENIISKIESILSSVEINEINLEKDVCELRAENKTQEE